MDKQAIGREAAQVCAECTAAFLLVAALCTCIKKGLIETAQVTDTSPTEAAAPDQLAGSEKDR